MQNFVYIQVGKQVELNARIVLQHLEANRVLAAQEFLVRINAKVEIIGKQIIVGPPLTVCARRMSAREGSRGVDGVCAVTIAASTSNDRKAKRNV